MIFGILATLRSLELAVDMNNIKRGNKAAQASAGEHNLNHQPLHARRATWRAAQPRVDAASAR